MWLNVSVHCRANLLPRGRQGRRQHSLQHVLEKEKAIPQCCVLLRKFHPAQVSLWNKVVYQHVRQKRFSILHFWVLSWFGCQSDPFQSPFFQGILKFKYAECCRGFTSSATSARSRAFCTVRGSTSSVFWAASLADGAGRSLCTVC